MKKSPKSYTLGTFSANFGKKFHLKFW